MSLQLGASGLTGEASPDEIERLAREFEANDVVALPRFLDAAFVELVHGLVDKTELGEFSHPGVGQELGTMTGTLMSALFFATNDPRLHHFVEQVTRTTPLKYFQGRIYRMVEVGTYDSWHSDVLGARRVGMSINLSPEPYEGGSLEMKDIEASDPRLRTIPNVTPGGVLIFRIADRLHHRVTNVVGPRAKTAYAGWFLSEPSFRDVLVGRI